MSINHPYPEPLVYMKRSGKAEMFTAPEDPARSSRSHRGSGFERSNPRTSEQKIASDLDLEDYNTRRF